MATLSDQVNDPAMRKCVEELHALARGVVLDGRLDDEELQRLQAWLEQNAAQAHRWPVAAVYELYRFIAADGIVTNDERRQLFNVLYSLIPPYREPSSPYASRPVVRFRRSSFFFMGELQCGDVQELQQRVQRLRGKCLNAPHETLDYLVLGDTEVLDPAQRRVVEGVVESCRRTGRTQIIRESDFVKALIDAPEESV